jgi:pimeloyl-ACP methyl ester carboxylesterase
VSPAQQEVFRVEHVLRADGFPEQEVEQAISFMRRKFEVAFTGRGWDELEAAVKMARAREWITFVFAPSSPDDLQSYRKFPHDFDPVPLWQQITCPVLAIFGERDMDVPVNASIAEIGEALRQGGNADYTFEVFPGADHVIMLSETGGFQNLPLTEGFAPDYFTKMTDWLAQRVTIRADAAR